MEENSKKHHCFLCNKYYKSKSSLSHHKRRYHKNNVTQKLPKSYPNLPKSYPNLPKSNPNLPKSYPNLPKSYPNLSKNDQKVIQDYPKSTKDKFTCEHCDKSFKYCSGLSRHKKMFH